jgi:ABC-type phosphate transport system substrate-binding protein
MQQLESRLDKNVKRVTRCPVFAHIWLLLTVFNLCQHARADVELKPTLIIGSSSSNAPIVELLAREFEAHNKGAIIKVISSIEAKGSLSGLETDRIQLVMIPSDLVPPTLRSHQKAIPYARSCLVFAVNEGVDTHITSVTDEEVAQIISGVRTTWPDTKPINVIFRPPGDSGADFILSRRPKLSTAFKAAWNGNFWRSEFQEKRSASMLSEIKGSFGWADQSFLNATKARVRILAFDGIKPNAEAAKMGSYRLVREYSMVHKFPSSDEVNAFVSFVKSKDGGTILRTHEAAAIN